MRTPLDALRSLQRHFAAVLDELWTGPAWEVAIARGDGTFRRPQLVISLPAPGQRPQGPAGRVDYRIAFAVQAYPPPGATAHDALLTAADVEHILEQALLDGRAGGWPRRIPLFDYDAKATAALVTGAEADDNALRWTSAVPGERGSAVAIALRDPGAPNLPLSVTISDDITVWLQTDAAWDVISSAAQVRAAVLAHPPAAALASVEHVGASTGAGVVSPVARTHLSGGASVGAGETVGEDAQTGYLRVDDVTVGAIVADPDDPRLMTVPATFFASWSRGALLPRPTWRDVTIELDHGTADL